MQYMERHARSLAYRIFASLRLFYRDLRDGQTVYTYLTAALREYSFRSSPIVIDIEEESGCQRGRMLERKVPRIEMRRFVVVTKKLREGLLLLKNALHFSSSRELFLFFSRRMVKRHDWTCSCDSSVSREGSF